jgi:dTDP-4-amino-4,6-dideoxygalactose transaminase
LLNTVFVYGVVVIATEKKTVPMFDLTRQWATLQEEFSRAMQDFLPRQQLVLGEATSKFEAQLAEKLGVKHVVAVSNGTDALLMALTALDIGPGDEVIVPAFTFFSTASVVSRLGAKPVFADILPDTFNINPDAIRRALSPRTRAIIPVHLFGQAAQMDDILAIAESRKIPVVEDCAQALGAKWRGQQVGSLGKMGCFSFYPTKNLGALGEGGAVSTNSDDLARRLRRIRAQGSEERYVHEELGGNFRLSALQCVALSVKLPHLDGWLEKRRQNAEFYRTRLEKFPAITVPQTAEGATHSWNQFCIRTQRRDSLREFLKENGVGTDVYYPRPVCLQPAFAELGHRHGDFPVADRVSAEVLALPIFPELRQDEQEYVCDVIGQFFL